MLAGTLVVLICLVLPDSVTRPMREKAMDLFGPVLRLAAQPIAFFSRVDSKMKTLTEAQAEVVRLQGEVDKLTVENQLLSKVEGDNKKLAEMLRYSEHSPYFLLPCRVISRDPSSWWETVQVNVGDENNNELQREYKGRYMLAPDQPVVSPRGVVGKTGAVSRYVHRCHPRRGPQLQHLGRSRGDP